MSKNKELQKKNQQNREFQKKSRISKKNIKN